MATETLLDAPPAGEGQTFPNQGIDSQPPTIKAFDIADPLVNVDQPNLIATAPTSNYSGVDANRISGISPTITSGLFGMRSKDIAKREVGDLDFDPNVKTIVTDPSAPIDNKIKALQSYEAESAKTIGDTEVGSRYKESAAGSLDRDIITGKSELWLAYRDAKLMEDFPTYKEREAFTEAAKTGRDNPDAYQDPAHKKHISDLVAVHDKLFGNNTQAWTANAQDSSGHEVANFTVKPSPDGEAHAFLRMRGPLAAVPPTAGQSLFESVAGPLAAMSQASRNIELLAGEPLPSAAKEDKGIDNFNATIKFKMPTADDVKSEQAKIEAQLAEIDKKIISAKATQDANNASPSSHGMFAGEAAADSVMASAGTQIAIDDLNAQKKNLLSRQDNLNNQGVRALANERVADAIRNDPKLLAQIPDKGKLNQLFTGFVDTMVVQPAVLGEELGNPFQKGALQTAADLHQLQGEMGVGGEQSKFRGWTRDTLTNAIIDSTPGSVVALLTGGAGRMLPVSEALGTVIGLNIGRATMSAEVYAQSIAQSEQIAHQMELSGDTAGAKERRDNMRWSGLGMATLEWLGEAAFRWDEMAILKKWNGGPANWARRAGVSGLTNFAEEFATQAGQGLLNPYTTGQPMDNPVGEQSWIAGAAGFVNGIVTNLAFAPFNQAGMTKEERLKAAMDFAQKMSEDAGVNPHDITPENTDISSPVVTNKDGETVINIRHMVIPDGGKNYVIADPAWRQRAFQAGVTAEFPDEQKAKEFAANMHQRIVEAEYLKSTEGTKATPEEIQAKLDLARNVIKVAAIGEKRSSNDIWARLGYGQVAEIIRNANASNPPAGTEQASPAGPATASAQAIENTLTGEERIRQSAVGGKLLADRLRTQEQAGQEASAMTAAWEKRRAHALAMQDQEPAYVSDAQGHPAVTTVLTALDAYDAAKTDEERLQVLDDVKLATVAAAERIAENTIAKIEADESLNEEEKKAMSEKWWKFAEDIKAVRVAAPESSFVKQEAPTARPTRHRVFDSPPAIRVSDGPTVLPAKNTESAYRVTGQSQIDDMLNTGEVRAKEGKMRGGRTGETQWSKGHENAGYNAETNDGRYVIETPVAGLNDRQGGLPLGEVTRVWKAENGKWVDVTESIKEKSKQEAPVPAAAKRAQRPSKSGRDTIKRKLMMGQELTPDEQKVKDDELAWVSETQKLPADSPELKDDETFKTWKSARNNVSAEHGVLVRSENGLRDISELHSAMLMRGETDEAAKLLAAVKATAPREENADEIRRKSKEQGDEISAEDAAKQAEANKNENDRLKSLIASMEAPAPATADQTAASTEAGTASQESSPPAQEPSLPAAAPVGTASIPATTENATPARDATKPEQMTPEEFVPVGNPVNQGIFKSKKEASVRLSELEETVSKSQQMLGILAEFNLVPSDAYEVAKDPAGRWSLGATHKHRIALAAREKQPVSKAAVDTYGITLPPGYTKQGDLYVYQKPSAPVTEKPSAKEPVSGEGDEKRGAAKPEAPAASPAAAPVGETSIPATTENATPATTFKTGRSGSEYTVFPDGTTQRNKAASDNPLATQHKDAGIKERSKQTVFVKSDAADAIGLIYAEPIEDPDGTKKSASVRVDPRAPDGSQSVTLTWYQGRDKDGKAIKRFKSFPASSSPEVGSHPLEIMDRSTHLGSPITSVSTEATPAPPTQEAKLQAGRKAIKEQDAKREAIKGKQPNVGDNVNFKEEGTTYTGKYLGPSKDAGFSRVEVKGKVFEPPNSNVAKYTPGVTLFQGEQGDGASPKGVTNILGQKTKSGGTLGSVQTLFTPEADSSTIIHEFIHSMALLETPIAGGGTRSLLESVLGEDRAASLYGWAMRGTENLDPAEGWKVMHERIAEGFDKWLLEGKMPLDAYNKPELVKAFDAIRNGMKNIVDGMLNPDLRYSYINPKSSLPSDVQKAYQQLFFLLENPSTHAPSQSKSPAQSMEDAAREGMNALYPYTTVTDKGVRIPATPLQAALALNLDPAGEGVLTSQLVLDAVEIGKKNAERANAGFSLFQTTRAAGALPFDQAKELLDVAMPITLAAAAKNNNQMVDFADWMQAMKEAKTPILNELTPGQREALYHAAALNIPSGLSIMARQRIDDAIVAAEGMEGLTVEQVNEAVAPAIAAMSPKMQKTANAIINRATTDAERKKALTSVMKVVRADARAKWAEASQNFKSLLRGYLAGNKNVDLVKDIISGINSVIRPVLKDADVSGSTKKAIAQTIMFVDKAFRGKADMTDISRQMLLHLQAIRADKARAAQTAFIKGAKVGEKYGAKRFEARQKAIIDVVSRELKTVASITPAQADRVMKMLRGATSDKQMNKAVWRALLLFQDQRVRDAHAELEARKEAIKANLKAGKFGDISGQVAEFNNFDVESIPSHFFAQYSDIAARLSSRDSVIDLNGVKNQVESMSRQLNDWLEANPQENEVRSQPLSNGFEEAMERLDAETALQDAMDGRKASSFMARQMEMGKTKKQAEMAMRMIEHGLVFRAFEEADPSTFSMFSTKELKAIAIAFQNYNEGIRTPYIYRQSKRLSEEILAKKMLPMLMHGVRQFLHLSQDTNLGVEASDLSAGGTLKQYIRRIMGFDQVLGTKPGRGSAPNEKTIKKQLDSHDQLRVDALLGTMNWMNENIVIPLQQAQGDGLLLRSELFHAKDEHGKTVTDYQRDLQGAENSPPWMEKLLDLGMISDAVKNIPFLQRIAHKREARREMHSRIMGIYMIQRQREANNMPGINYADFVKAGAIGRNPSKFAVNEHARQLSAIEAIKAGLAATWSDRLRKSREGMAEGSKEADLAAMNSANIYELLPEPARRAIKLADHVFSLTGEMTYGLNMFEREKPLPMPLKYFPIHAMADRIAISDKVASYKAGQNERASASSMRADARHARTDENLKFQNADFFGVFTDAVHEAAADSAMTPPVKVMNGAMTKMAKSGLFAATAGNVVTGLQNSMLEYAARYSHAIANNEAVTRSILGVATSMVHRMFLPKIIRPIIEGIQNGIAIAVSSHFKDYRRGTSEYSIMGRDKFWDRVMIEQRAPSAFRGATEATVGLMHSLTDSLDFRSEGDHVPGAWEEFLVDAQHVPLAERGLARLQSHRLAQGVKAASDLTVTLGEKMYIRQLWTGAYVNSLEKQTGTPFARENMSTYTAEQRQAALAAAEVAVAKILAPSARGATRQAGQIPLDGDQLKTIKQNIFYALTSFSGALSSTARLGIKDVMSNRSTQADRVAGLRDVTAVVVGGVVGNTLQGIYMTTMPALALYIAMALRGDDKDEEDSPQFQKLRRFVERMNPFDGGLGDTGQFWLHRLMAGAFQARFGGANSIVRFAAATGAEVLNALAVKALREKPYDIYNDNFTMEATPGATAAVLDAGLSIFGSSDPELRRAWQNTNMTDGIKLFSPISAIFQWLGETTKDLQTIGSGLRGEQDYGGAMLDLVAQIAIPLQLFPLSRDITLATKTARDMTSPDYTTYMKNLNLKEAKRLGRDMFYEPGQKPAIIEKLNKLSPPERAAALKENMKLESFRNAYTVPDKPELTAELKKHLGDIRDAPESKIADVIYGAYYAMKKKGMENEMIARLLYLMHRPEWGSHFTVPNEAGLAPAQALQEKEMQERNDAPIWRQLYSR